MSSVTPTTDLRSPLEGFAEKTIHAADRTIRYLEWGTGEPVIVVHGANGWLRNISEEHHELARDFRVLALELPGFGGTSAKGIQSVRDLAAVVSAFATALDIKHYSLIGTSVGGAVALWTAIDSPDAVEKLVLEAPAAFRAGSPPPGPPRDGGPGLDPATVAFLGTILGPPTDEALVAAMPNCMIETLVMFGADDVMFPPRFARDYKMLPNAHVAIVYKAGHDIKGSRPSAFLDIVSDFLHRGSAFVVSESSTLIHP